MAEVNELILNVDHTNLKVMNNLQDILLLWLFNNLIVYDFKNILCLPNYLFIHLSQETIMIIV